MVHWTTYVVLWTCLATFVSFTPLVTGQEDRSQLKCNAAILRRGRQQCFNEKPDAYVYAPMGDTVVLKCEVGNLGGRIQWIHNISGFLGSGINPIQKTYAFSYLGNFQRGEKNLQIRNLSMALQGKYECQVPPKPNLLRSATNVIMLVKPTVPVITADGVPLENRAKMSIRPKAPYQEFFCSAVGGSPAPVINWYLAAPRSRRRTPLKTDKGTLTIPGADLLSNRYERRLRLLRRQMKDGQRLICTVQNRATKLHQDPARKQLTTEVVLELQKPPGMPKIHSSGNRRIYNEGDPFAAVCTATRGVPPGSLIWRQIFADLTPGRLFLSYTASKKILTNRLHIPMLTKLDHNSRFICESSNDVTVEPLQTSVSLKVNFAPHSVTIRSSPNAENRVTPVPGGQRELVVYGQAGHPKTLTCVTDFYYPTVNVTWWREGRKIPSESRTYVNNPKGYITEANISVTLTRDDNNRFYDCRAYGVKGGRADARVKLSIMYPPRKPKLTTNGKERIGNMLKLTCMSEGGSPQPNLFFYRVRANTGEAEEVTGERLHTVGNRRSRAFKLTLSKEDNGDQYYCEARSEAMSPSQILRSNKHKVNVLFPPASVSISLQKPSTADGEFTVVTCKAASSNPKALIRWRHRSCWKKQCKTMSIEASNEEAVVGHYAGTITRSEIRLPTTWRDHGSTILCEAFNNLLNEAPSVNNQVILNITYAPKFFAFGNRGFGRKTITEGSNTTLEMGVKANPPVTYFSWLFDDKVFRGNSRVRPVRGKLVLQNVNRTDAGNYTLVASNARGNGQLKFFLDITFPPSIVGPTRVNMTVTNDSKLECEARANPAPRNKFAWRKFETLNFKSVPALTVDCHDGQWTPSYRYYAQCKHPSTPTPSEQREGGLGNQQMKSTLFIYNVTSAQNGYYQCVADNGVGKPAIKIFEVIVPSKPKMKSNPRLTKAAGELGNPIRLKCQAEGEPKISFTWFRSPDNLTLVEKRKYKMGFKRVKPGLYESTLQIYNLQISDYGSYFCKARNALGTATLRLRVSRTGAPDIPSNLRIVNATDRSVKISWSQGFNGGSTQTFNLRWRALDEKLYDYRDVASIQSEEKIEYIIDGLESGKKYEISVSAKNRLHGSSLYCQSIIVSTKSALGPIDRGKSSLEEDMPVLIIVAACVFAFIVLVINVVVVAFILRRRGHCGGGMRGYSRKERVSQNGKGVLYLKTGTGDAYELRSSHTGDGSYRRGSLQGDDDKTYSSYDATSDEVRDLIKKYPNEMFVPHNAYVDLLYPATAFRHPSLAPIGETQLMAHNRAAAMLAAPMDQPTLMARPSPLARTSPSSLSATSHERAATTFQPIVLLNQHGTNPEMAVPNYPMNGASPAADIMTNGYRSGSLTTFPSIPLAQADAQQRHSYAEELRRVQYNAALAAGMQPTHTNLSTPKPMSGPGSNSSTLNSRHYPGPIEINMSPVPPTAFAQPGSRSESPMARPTPVSPVSAAGNSASVSSADTVIRYTPHGGPSNTTSALVRSSVDYMV